MSFPTARMGSPSPPEPPSTAQENAYRPVEAARNVFTKQKPSEGTPIVPRHFVCTECDKPITLDPTRPIADINDLLFIAAEPNASRNKPAVAVCGKCATNIVWTQLARSGRL